MSTKNRTWIALAALLVGAIVLIAMLWSEDAGAAASQTADASDAARSVSATKPADAPIKRIDAAPAATRSEAQSQPLAPVESQAEALAARGVELAPVHGALRRRVEGVSMWWWPQAQRFVPPGEPNFEDRLREGGFDEVFEAHAEPLEPDADGRFFAPRAGETGMAVAQAPGMWGYAFVAREQPAPCYVPLERDADIVVRVSTSSGSPASGVRVALREHYSPSHFYDHVYAVTGEDGLARLKHVYAACGRNHWFSSSLQVAVAEALGEHVGVELDLERIPSEPVELVVAPFGSVVVEVAGVDALEESEGVWISLRAFESGSDPDGRELWTRDPRRVESGRAVFPCVALGREVMAWTSADGSDPKARTVRAPGPTRAGEAVTVRLDLQRGRIVFRGRLLNEKGAPVASREFSARAFTTQTERGELGAAFGRRSDEQGRFEFTLRGQLETLERLDFEVRDGRDLRSHFASVRMSGARGDAIELGDIALDPLPTLVSGIVLDADGTPAAFAEVELHEMGGDEHADSGLVYWAQRWPDVVRTDRAGRFEVRSEDTPKGALAVWAKGDVRRSAPRPVTLGEADVVLRLDWDGVIAGRVLLERSVARGQVEIQVDERDVGPTELRLDEWRDVTLDSNGEFVVRGLPRFGHDLTVSVDGASEPLALVENVLPTSDVDSRDARLDPLDLRGVSGFFEFRVLDMDGGRIEYGEAMWSIDGSDENIGSEWFDNGRLRLARSLAGTDMWIIADDYRPLAFEPSSAGEELRLQRATRVRARLADGLSLPPAPIEVHLTLNADTESDLSGQWFQDSLEFGAQGWAEGTCRSSGPLKATFWLELEGAWTFVAAEIVEGATPVDGPNGHAMVLRYDAEEFARAIEALKK